MGAWYNNFLKSKEWIEFRDKYKAKECWCCFGTNNLNLHHLWYEDGLLKPIAVETLCDKCHHTVHFSKRGKFYGGGTERIYRKALRIRRLSMRKLGMIEH